MSPVVRCIAVAAVWLAGFVVAQEPVRGASPEPPATREPTPEQQKLASDLLRRHGERCRDVGVLVADYVQRRTTSLRKEPLVSSGAFLFVKEPACVMFRASAPRASVVRLTTNRYEVFRPQQKRLERFVLDGPELAAGLFAVLGGDVAVLQRDFELVSCAAEPADPGLVRVRMRPRSEPVRERLAEIGLTLRGPGADLESVAYRDHAGDLVEIELAKLRRDPEAPPSAELDVPPGTQVLEHAPPKRRDGSGR